ncbi:MAG: class I SAM-dependent methyltransferase [Gammaproteobacteria bacterium]|nr:class I SAM-dependent methyltransferase [Gammaproteobacteria bacterium]
MDMIKHNREAWNRLSDGGIIWGIPVDSETISRARAGDWQVQLAGGTPVPHAWFDVDGNVTNKDILCLASGGGQQAPLLAAAGANVTSLELSDSMLAKDRSLATEHGLDLSCEQGSMTDLSRFADASFDLVFLPVAACYVPDVHVIWRECARVLRPNGRLLVGVINPLVNLFEENEGEPDIGLQVVNELPFAEIEVLSDEERAAAIERGMVFVWSHTLTDLIGGQLSAGFRILAFTEARRTDPRAPSINKYTDTYFMTAAELVR